MKLALATATVGMATTTHIIYAEEIQRNGRTVLNGWGVYCGARRSGSGYRMSSVLTQAVEGGYFEKSASDILIFEAMPKIQELKGAVCQKCLKNADHLYQVALERQAEADGQVA